MSQTAEIKLKFPETARDASVILLEQVMIALNEGQLVVSDPKYQPALDSFKDLAALTLSDAKTETRS